VNATRFTVFARASWGEFETHLIGEFNVRNCLAVIIAADAWGISKEKIQEAFDTFKSVKRRMEVRGTVGGVTVIDDFAHHPTAVEETLKALADEIRRPPPDRRFRAAHVVIAARRFQEPYTKAFVVRRSRYHRRRLTTPQKPASSARSSMSMNSSPTSNMQGKPCDELSRRRHHHRAPHDARTRGRRRHRHNVQRRLRRHPRGVRLKSNFAPALAKFAGIGADLFSGELCRRSRPTVST
jgi:hypothetical protein